MFICWLGEGKRLENFYFPEVSRMIKSMSRIHVRILNSPPGHFSPMAEVGGRRQAGSMVEDDGWNEVDDRITRLDE